jgi:hypothetical protein
MDSKKTLQKFWYSAIQLFISKNMSFKLKIKVWKVLMIMIIPTIIFFIICYHRHETKPQLELKTNIEILCPAKSLSIQKNEIRTHNFDLIALLEESKKPSEEGLRQVRTNYFLIIAGILSLILGIERKGKGKLSLYIVILSVITLLYALDVHLIDQFNRQNAYYDITLGNIENIINNGSVNSTCYEIYRGDINLEWKKFGEKIKRRQRKVYMAFHPDMEQIVYFVIPWLMVYILGAFEFVKETERVNATENIKSKG